MTHKIFSRIHLALFALLLVAVPHFLYSFSLWNTIPLDGDLIIGQTDPDTWMRLSVVREWLMSGDWYSHIVPRTNTPWDASVTPWTRPLDVVIATLVYLQPSDIPLDMRLMRAALLLPCIWMALLISGIFCILHRMHVAPSAYLMAALLAAASPMVWNYFGTGNADHHAPLAALFIWAMGAIFHPGPTKRQLVVSGVLFGVMLWMSMEAAILIGIVYVWYGLEWLRGSRIAMERLTLLSTTIAFSSLIALMIEFQPTEWFTPRYDANSIVYTVLMTLAALLAWQLHLSPRETLAGKLFIASASAAVMGGFFFALYPEASRGPMAEVTPYVITYFLPLVSEVRYPWTNGYIYLIAASIQPIFAMLLLTATWREKERAYFYPREAAVLLYFTGTMFVLYLTQQRWNYYIFPMLGLAIAPVLGAMFEPDHLSVRDRWPTKYFLALSEKARATRRIPIVLLIVGLPLLLIYTNNEIVNVTDDVARRAQRQRKEYCYDHVAQVIRSGALDRIDGRDSLSLLLPTDLGGEIIFFTNHRIVASNYHREGDGIEYVRTAEQFAEEGALRHHLAKRSIDAVLVCPTILERTPGSILQSIADGGAPPDWLTPIAIALPEKSEATRAREKETPPPEHALPQLLIVNGR